MIDALNERGEHEIGIASPNHEKIQVTHVRRINNKENPADVVLAIAEADIVTTAIGPNILPFIAELCAKGIQERRASGNKAHLILLRVRI